MKSGGTGGAKGAPTFQTMKETTMVTTGWVLHYVEYTLADGSENTITANKPPVAIANLVPAQLSGILVDPNFI